MDNPEKLATQDTQDEDKQNKDNPEKLATQDTQDEDKQNVHSEIYLKQLMSNREFSPVFYIN